MIKISIPLIIWQEDRRRVTEAAANLSLPFIRSFLPFTSTEEISIKVKSVS